MPILKLLSESSSEDDGLRDVRKYGDFIVASNWDDALLGFEIHGGALQRTWRRDVSFDDLCACHLGEQRIVSLVNRTLSVLDPGTGKPLWERTEARLHGRELFSTAGCVAVFQQFDGVIGRRTAHGLVMRFDAQTGKELPPLNLGQPIVDITLVDKNQVVLLLRELIIVLDLASGAEIAKVFVKRIGLRRKFENQFVVAARNCFVVVDDSKVVGYSTDRGEVLWVAEPPGRALSSESFEPSDDEVFPPGLGMPLYLKERDWILVADLNACLHAIDASEGRLIWTFEGLDDGSAQCVGVPAVVRLDGCEYVALPNADECLYLLDLDEGALLDKHQAVAPMEIRIVGIGDARFLVPLGNLALWGVV